MKDENQVIKEFNEVVNMTSSELEEWLKSDQSESAGWPKDEGEGESVGHDSGRKIVEILKSNPKKDPSKYTGDQVQHMRKVVSYCKRHLAQEERSNNEKSAEEVKKTKSYASLKNWGHDPLKKRGEADAEDDDDENSKDADEDKQAGDKRKKDVEDQSGENKKRETRKGASEKENGAEEKAKSNGDKNKTNEEDEDENEDDGEDEDKDSKPKKGPKKGETVSWNWGNGNPKGKVLDVKGDKATITTKRGNEVSRDGDPEDPAVILDTGKSKAIKSNHELN